MSLSLNVPILRRKVLTLVTSLQNINVTVLGLNDRQVLGLHDRPTPCQNSEDRVKEL